MSADRGKKEEFAHKPLADLVGRSSPERWNRHPDRRSGSERRSGKERRSGDERRVDWASSETYPERRSGRDRRAGVERRSGEDRRKRQIPIDFPDRRSGKERRSGLDRRKGERRRTKPRIPIFIKLATLSTLLILFVISAISFSMLKKQKEQFTSQLIDLGKSMVRIATKNAPDKLLGEEDMALFQLVNDIAQNEQVVYALIIDKKNIIKAHSHIDEVNKTYTPPENAVFIKEEGEIRISTIKHDAEQLLFFESPITYQKLKIGEVYIGISQKMVLQSIRDAKIFILVLTTIITLLGILFSLGLSMYFSNPIRKLGETTRALGMGDFNHRVRIDRNDEFGDLAYSFNRMAEDLELKEKIKDIFGRYVTPEVVEMIVKDPDNPRIKASKVDATILFVDIRGFTSLSEDIEPERVTELLNEYFTRVTYTILRHGGHSNKFVGDEAMVVFGAPVPNPGHAEAAVKAALDIQEEIARLNWERKHEGISFQVGIGINSGEMVGGSLGPEKRMEYTVIGDNVNVASRLTSMAKGGEILISKQTYESIAKNRINVEEKGQVSVKGRRGGIKTFKVLSLDGDQYGFGQK
jgi:adenylate cyclase